MSPGATFERVYLALKEQLGSGRFAPGEHLEPTALALDLNASITPVRDALHRLVGEGLAEAPRGDGFRTPVVTEMGLRHLYRWNAVLLTLATRSRGPRLPDLADVSQVPGPLCETESLFLQISARSGSPENLAAIARLNDRLRPVRRVELELLSNAAGDLGEIAAALKSEAADKLRRAIASYHRVRERLAAEIVEALRRRR
jgi:DNA-binding FadR family transcriptional regulator